MDNLLNAVKATGKNFRINRAGNIEIEYTPGETLGYAGWNTCAPKRVLNRVAVLNPNQGKISVKVDYGEASLRQIDGKSSGLTEDQMIRWLYRTYLG